MNYILIKEILEFVEKNRRSDGRQMALCLNGYTNDEIQYHARLCDEAGFFTRLRGPSTIYPIELTLAGHRKLEELKDNDPCSCKL